MTQSPIAYSVADACKALSIGKTHLYAAIKRGELNTRKAGKRTLITAEALKSWLENLPSGQRGARNDGGRDA